MGIVPSAMIKTFYRYEPSGRFIGEIYLDPVEAALQGPSTLEPPPLRDGAWPWRINDKWEMRPMDEQLPSYASQRAAMYPEIADQLDMLWHAMNNGEIPIAPGFYSVLKSIKDAHPKETTTFEVGQMPGA